MNRQRERALATHKLILKRKTEGKLVDSYNTHCKKGPSLLQRAGIAQGLVFLRSRKPEKDMGRAYVDDVAMVYNKEWDGKTLQEKALSHDFQNYLVLSNDLLEITTWFRRFAQVELGGSELEGQD
jgi:CRISPR type III-B/RAMP module-associated protein Cmr5